MLYIRPLELINLITENLTPLSILTLFLYPEASGNPPLYSVTMSPT